MNTAELERISSQIHARGWGGRGAARIRMGGANKRFWFAECPLCELEWGRRAGLGLKLGGYGAKNSSHNGLIRLVRGLALGRGGVRLPDRTGVVVCPPNTVTTSPRFSHQEGGNGRD